jgi:uncharacterized protein YjiS (DUF1127 family)
MAALMIETIVQLQHTPRLGIERHAGTAKTAPAAPNRKTRAAMAHVETSIRSSGAERLNGTIARLVAAWRRRTLYTRTLRELRALSDRELADLGLHRSELRRIARYAASNAQGRAA